MSAPEHTGHSRQPVQLPAAVEVVLLAVLAVLVAVLEVL